jgi:electron transfer flavoprotein beta subunit
MKILVSAKRVIDPDARIKLLPGGSGIDTESVEYKVNPFDENAIEEALCLADAHEGEVIVVSIGPEAVTQTIRSGLAMGAARGIRVDWTDEQLDSDLAARILAAVVAKESPDLCIFGKQAIDGDNNQVGQLVAQYIGSAQGCFASDVNTAETINKLASAHEAAQAALRAAGNEPTAEQIADKIGMRADKMARGLALVGQALEADELFVTREVDGGLETIALQRPAVVTADLRLNEPRYASLPGIMKAKRKPIDVLSLDDLGVTDTALKVEVVALEEPGTKEAGIMVETVDELLDKLTNEAKVL